MEGMILRNSLEDLKEAKKLEDLEEKQLRSVVAYAQLQKYAKIATRKSEVMNIDFEEAKKIFLDTKQSKHTKTTYNTAICDFYDYIKKRGIIDFADITKKTALDWLLSINGQKATIQNKMHSLHSFFDFVVDYYELQEFQNPFDNLHKRIKAQPQQEKNAFYNEIISKTTLKRAFADLNTTIKYFADKRDIITASILTIIKYTGMRIGAFNSDFQKRENYLITISKGKKYIISCTRELILAMQTLKGTYAFSEVKTENITTKINYTLKVLHHRGKIARHYSVHDFRHLFALTYYYKTRDIIGLRNILNHTSIATTEKYLKGFHFAQESVHFFEGNKIYKETLQNSVAPSNFANSEVLEDDEQ